MALFQRLRRRPTRCSNCAGIPDTEHSDFRNCVADFVQLAGSEFQRRRCQVLFQAMEFRSTRDGNNPWLLCEQPGERNLCRRLRACRLRSDRAHRPAPGCLLCLLREARHDVTEIGAVESCVQVYRPVRKPLPNRLMGTKPIPRSSSVGRISTRAGEDPEIRRLHLVFTPVIEAYEDAVLDFPIPAFFDAVVECFFRSRGPAPGFTAGRAPSRRFSIHCLGKFISASLVVPVSQSRNRRWDLCRSRWLYFEGRPANPHS